MLGNRRLEVWELLIPSIFHVLAEHKPIAVPPRTEFDQDNHSTLAPSLTTSDGRAPQLVWSTVKSSELPSQCNQLESDVIEHPYNALSQEAEIILLADGSFKGHRRYVQLDLLGPS